MDVGFIITHLSDGSPGSFERVHLMSRHLMNRGINTTILTPFAEDKNNVTDVDVRLIPTRMSAIGMSSVLYKIARKFASSPLGATLFLSDASINRMVQTIRTGMLRLLERKKFNILHAIQPIAALACGTIAKQFNLPIVADLHNIWPEDLVTEGIIKRDDKTFKRLHEIEQKIIDLSDAVTVVSEFMRTYILKNYSAEKKPIVVVPPAGFCSGTVSQRRERNVVYTGSVSQREHVDLFAESTPFVKNHVSFFISNVGDSLQEIKRITRKPGYPKVNYTWFPKREEAIQFLERSKIGILTSYDDMSRQLGPPCKLYEYMSCGVPIVANNIGGWSEMIGKEKIGLLTEDDPKDFAQSIDSIIDNEFKWKEMHENALRLVRRKYNWGVNVQEQLIPLYQKLLK